jgi:hypothetical protein
LGEVVRPQRQQQLLRGSGVKLAPQQAQLLGEWAAQILGALDAGMTGGAEGHQAGELGDPWLAVVNNQQSVGAATPALVMVAEKNFIAQPGKVPPAPALALVAAPAFPGCVYKCRAARAEEGALPEARPGLAVRMALPMDHRSQMLVHGK